MQNLKRLGPALLVAASLSLAGCGSAPPPPPPHTVSLNQVYTMIDTSGRIAGQVTFTPVGDGQVTDVNGNIVGRIVKP